jgi:hypothetical protein
MEIKLNRKDPVFDFSMRFGELQKTFLSATQPPNMVFLLWGGTFYMLPWELDEIISQIKCFVKWTRIDVVFFLSRHLEGHHPLDNPLQDLANTPSVNDLDDMSWLGIIKDVIEKNGLVDISIYDALIANKHQFSSLSELRRSVEDFAEKDDISAPAFKNHLDELFARSKPWEPLISWECLQERWDRSLTTLENLNKDMILYRDWERKRNPFSCDLPIYWFETLVSVLANIVIDAGKNGIKVIISRFQFNEKSNHLQGDPATEFYKRLYLLRTFHLHGMDPSKDEDRKKIEAVEEWFLSNKADRQPTLLCYRRLAMALLFEWEKAVENIGKVVAHVVNCEECRTQIEEQVTKETLDIPDNDVSNAIKAYFENNEVGDVSENEFRSQFLSKIKTRLKSSCVSPESMYLKLNAIIRECIHETFALFPINGDWLKKKGVPPGKPLGVLLQEFEAYWKDNLSVTHEEMIEYAERRCEEELKKLQT